MHDDGVLESLIPVIEKAEDHASEKERKRRMELEMEEMRERE